MLNQEPQKLIILAGGLGTRFGGPKQLTPIGQNGECMIEISAAQARTAGIDDVVILTRLELVSRIENEVLPRWQGNLPQIVIQSEMLGTAHAVWSCRHVVKGQFLVINGDDHYGAETFQLGVNLLSECQQDEGILIPFRLTSTLSQHGGVNRGWVRGENGVLTGLSEVTDIMATGEVIKGNEVGVGEVELPPDTPVSLNFYGFPPTFFDFLDQQLPIHFSDNPGKEAFLPEFVGQAILQNVLRMRYKLSSAEWFGMTYAEDLAYVREKLSR